MPVVSNTSPIFNLIKINRFNLLKFQFDKILIPEAVHSELTRLLSADELKELKSAIQTGFIQVSTPIHRNTVQALLGTLHIGESEAIALALETKAELILLDETDARKKAAEFGLRMTGVLGILLQAKEQGQIPEIKAEMVNLHERANFYISKAILEKILAVAGE